MSYYLELLERQGRQLTKAEESARQNIGQQMPRMKRRTSAFDPTTGYRICTRCDTPKPPQEYTTNRQNADGRDARCNRCKASEAKRWYGNT